jgi:hypothetical protein
MLLFGVYSFEIKNRETGKNLFLYLVFAALILMVSLRYRVGGDALFYENYFSHLPDIKSFVRFYLNDNYLNYQPLWVLLVAISKTIINQVIFFHFLHSLIFNFTLYFFLKRYTDKPFSVLLVFFVTMLYFYYSFEIQRQTMAIAVFLIGVQYLEEKRWLRYFLLAVLAYFFHVSAVIMFIFPLIGMIKFNRVMIYVVLSLSFVMFFFRFELLDFIKPVLVNDYIKLKMQAYSEIQFSTLGFWAFFSVRVFLFLPLLLFSMSKTYTESRFRWFYPTYFLISVSAQFFVGSERLLNFIIPVYFILVVDFFYKYFPQIKNIWLRYFIGATIVLHVFFIMTYKLFVVNEYGQRYVSVFFPYNSVFNPEINEERELFYENQW